jgi:hypothetical protein
LVREDRTEQERLQPTRDPLVFGVCDVVRCGLLCPPQVVDKQVRHFVNCGRYQDFVFFHKWRVEPDISGAFDRVPVNVRVAFQGRVCLKVGPKVDQPESFLSLLERVDEDLVSGLHGSEKFAHSARAVKIENITTNITVSFIVVPPNET